MVGGLQVSFTTDEVTIDTDRLDGAWVGPCKKKDVFQSFIIEKRNIKLEFYIPC